MELRNDFRVGVPPETAWAVLNDVERIAPCVPGAQLQEIEGDEYRGVVKVRVGPITAQYKGKAVFVEQDQAAGRVVLKATGRDTGGGGSANATITATLVADGDGTLVTVLTDLAITGTLAHFGRGVLAEVSAKLLDQFVARLEADVLAAGPGSEEPSRYATANGRASADAAEAGPVPRPPPVVDVTTNGSPPDAGPAIRRLDGPEVEPVDLLDAAGSPVAKRALPALAGLAGMAVVVLLWRRHRR